MRCVDVNVLVYAHRPESPDHAGHRDWLDHARRDPEPLGLSDVVASGFLRVVTHPRVFREPTPLGLGLEFLTALRTSPATTPIAPGDRHWDLFVDLCERTGATGNRVPDAYLAALAIEHGAAWITADRGFARFPGLRWRHPLDER
jgi:toxin-antitoxin system PIN domain toxin